MIELWTCVVRSRWRLTTRKESVHPWVQVVWGNSLKASQRCPFSRMDRTDGQQGSWMCEKCCFIFWQIQHRLGGCTSVWTLRVLPVCYLSVSLFGRCQISSVSAGSGWKRPTREHTAQLPTHTAFLPVNQRHTYDRFQPSTPLLLFKTFSVLPADSERKFISISQYSSSIAAAVEDWITCPPSPISLDLSRTKKTHGLILQSHVQTLIWSLTTSAESSGNHSGLVGVSPDWTLLV